MALVRADFLIPTCSLQSDSYLGIMADQSLYYPLGDGSDEGKVAHVDLNDVGEVRILDKI